MIVRFEIKKIICVPAILGFAVLLAVLNCVVAVGLSRSEEIDYINAVNTIAGNKFSASYTKKLESILPPDEDSVESWFHEDLLAAAQNFDIRTAKHYAEELENYEQSLEAENEFFGKIIASLMARKYEKAGIEAARKLACGEINYVAFAGETGRIFNSVSGTLGVLMVAECSLIAVLAVMYSLSCEHISGADMLVYSTRKGRRKIVLSKIAASVLVSSGVYAFIFILGYGIYFALNDFSQVWNVPVSAYYNFISVNSNGMPVLAWSSMTFLEYFIFSSLLGYAIMLVFMLFAAAVGLASKNTYAGFGLLALTVLLNVALIVVPPDSPAGLLLINMFPAGIINTMPAWFQYGSSITLFAYQETILVILWLLLMAAVLAVSLRYFAKKDIR